MDGQAVGNENGAGGRSKALDAAAAAATAETDGIVGSEGADAAAVDSGGGGGGNELRVGGKLVGLDSVADGDGERPFDDGQCGDMRCCC